MSEQDALPADPAEAPSHRPKPPGGRRRSQVDIDGMLDKIEALLLYGVPRLKVLKAMADEHQLPNRTCDKYIAMVRDRWQDQVADREVAKQRQILRLYSQLRKLQLENNHIEVWRREKLLAQIEGTLAPLQLTQLVRSTWEGLTAEQLAYIRDNNGKLPPGVTAEMLFPRR